MFDKQYEKLVQSKNLIEKYEMLKRVSRKSSTEYYNYLMEEIKKETNEDIESIPNYYEYNEKELEQEKDNLEESNILRLKIIDKLLSNFELQKIRGNEIVLASRSDRFFAILVDSLIIAVPLIIFYLVLLFYGFNLITNLENSSLVNFIFAFSAQVIYLMINGELLYEKGQTRGKKYMGIKIVNLDNSLPSIVDSYGKRYLSMIVINYIPIIGIIISLLDPFLFLEKIEDACMI